jgi:hypothetical protein
MAEEPWDWLLMTDAEELYARSRARMEVTERLIKQSREVLESSRALLDRTRPISPTDLVAAWLAAAEFRSQPCSSSPQKCGDRIPLTL